MALKKALTIDQHVRRLLLLTISRIIKIVLKGIGTATLQGTSTITRGSVKLKKQDAALLLPFHKVSVLV